MKLSRVVFLVRLSVAELHFVFTGNASRALEFQGSNKYQLMDKVHQILRRSCLAKASCPPNFIPVLPIFTMSSEEKNAARCDIHVVY